MAAHVDQKRRQSGPAGCSGCSGPEPGAGRPRSTSVREGSPYSADTDRPESPQGAACLVHAAPRAASDGSSPPQATSERGRRVSSPPGLQMTAERSGQTGSPGSVVTDVPQRRAPAGAPAAPCGRRSGCDTTGSPQPTDLFDDFLKNWVRQIPIHTSDPEEIALLDKMRLGIYVGVWRAITKLQMNPTAGSNPFYYRDLLEDELDELLNLLPDSCELHGARPRLKAQLIETATAARQRFTFADTSASYKRQLVNSVVRNIPRRTIDRTDVNVDRLVEEVHRLRLADDYIMYVANRDRDRVKANVYRNKLEKHVQRLIDDIKRSEGESARDGAPHRDDIMKALHRVPPPGEDIIREEAALVLLGAEVEQWSADLPLHPPADPVEALARRRHRNVLTKKLHDLDRRVGLAACEPQLRQEVRKFIEKLPLIADENDVDFMVDELVNRLRNMPADTATGGGCHMAEPGGFHDFSRDLPLCSSRNEAHGGESYMIVGGERVDSCSPSAPHVQRRLDLTPESQQQWYTLEETGPPPSDDPRQTCGVRCSVAVQTPAAVSFREPAEDSAPRPPGYVNSSAPPVDPRREKDDTRAYEREKRQSTVATSSPCCGRTSETMNRAVPRGQTSVGTGQSSQSCRQTSRDTGYGTRGPSPAAASTERHSRAAQVQTSSSLQEEEEEVRCRCTERVWRRRKPPPLGVAYDDYDVDFPPCFPVRYACPYYF